jgi:hypothetical protein
LFVEELAHLVGVALIRALVLLLGDARIKLPQLTPQVGLLLPQFGADAADGQGAGLA